MTIFAGNLSSEGGDRSVLAPAEINAQELSKGSRIRYTRGYLVSLAKLSTGKGLPRGIEPSVLSELDDSWLDHPWEVSNDSDSESCQGNYQDKGLLSSENIGLLGVGSLRRVQGDIADASPPKVEENILSLLHKSKEPYRPPHLLKADWNDYKDEAWVSPEYLSKNGQKQNWGKDFPEVMKAGQKEALLQKQKKNSSERDKKVQPMMPLDMSENDEIINSLAPENSDTTATHTKSPANCSEFAQFPAIEENPADCISCNEASEFITHGIYEHSTMAPDKHLKSTTNETSELYGCRIPAVILGVLACVGLEHIFKPETKEISCSMIWDGCTSEDGKKDSGNHRGSHHYMLLPDKGTEQKDTTASSERNIAPDELHPSDSTTDNNKLKFVNKENAGQPVKDLFREPSFGRSSRKGLQLTDASSCIPQSSIGRSTRKSVSETCKFFFPVANKIGLASASCKDKSSVISSGAIVSSSSIDQSKGMDYQSISDDTKLYPLCCSDDKDALPLELCLPDEDSLITVDDFRIVTYKDMLEKNQVKGNKVTPSAPVESSEKPIDIKALIKDDKPTPAYKSAAPVYRLKAPYSAPPELINSQVKAINPRFKPLNSSNQAFSTNVLPTTYHQSQAKPYQQTVSTTYMQEMYHVQAFPWSYQMSSYGCVPLPVAPTPGVYGGTNQYGTQNNAGTSYYLGWQ